MDEQRFNMSVMTDTSPPKIDQLVAEAPTRTAVPIVPAEVFRLYAPLRCFAARTEPPSGHSRKPQTAAA
jgi:hypothetical protein